MAFSYETGHQSQGAFVRECERLENEVENGEGDDAALRELMFEFNKEVNQYDQVSGSNTRGPADGEAILEARRRKQQSNRFTASKEVDFSVSVARIGTDGMYRAARSVQALNEKENTQKAYDPKKAEFNAFCEWYSGGEITPTTYTVTQEKVERFIFYHTFRNYYNYTEGETKTKGNRKKKKKRNPDDPPKPKRPLFDPVDYEKVWKKFNPQLGGSAGDPETGIGESTFIQYKAAVKHIYDEQHACNINNLSWDQIWTSRCDTCLSVVKGRRTRIKKKNYFEKVDHDTPFETAENIQKMEKGFWDSGNDGTVQQNFASLRNRFCFLMTVHAILRGESMYKAELSDLYCIKWRGSDGHYQDDFSVLMMQIATGKTNKELKLYGRAGRHKDVQLCCVGALAFYLFYRFEKTNEFSDGKVDFTQNKTWFDTKLLVDYRGPSKDYSSCISSKTYAVSIAKMLSILLISSSHLLHIGRKWGSYGCQLRGDDTREIQCLGNWDPSTQEKAYSINIPINIIRSAAGYDSTCKVHVCPRSSCKPPDELRKQVFPWVDDAQEKVRISQAEGNDHRTAIKFLDLMDHLRDILLQDAAAMMVLHPFRKNHLLFQHPLFQSEVFADYQTQMQTVLLNATDPMDAQLEVVLPGVNTRLNNIASEYKQTKEAVMEMNQRMDNMSGMVLSNFQHLMHWINLKNASNTIRLGQTVRQFGEAIIDTVVSPIGPPTVLETVTDSTTASNSSPGNSSNTQQTPFPGFGHQMFDGVHPSVQDIYDEWYGLGKFKDIPIEGGIDAMERLYSSKWRMHRNPKGFPKRFSRIRMIVTAINDCLINGPNGNNLSQVIDQMNELYQKEAERKLAPFVEKVLVRHNYRSPSKKQKIT